ncbi:SKT5 [[Candida] subhashii]|uniref:SKT5 n=1 Tax=[Candida] subhashii TaxID=561895 RepID=A0A8J5UZ33_9ASCO|nr:SKT5 [[Candida] subhashii]KAG7664715.1 SKT5 [[Candida] subhashii]
MTSHPYRSQLSNNNNTSTVPYPVEEVQTPTESQPQIYDNQPNYIQTNKYVDEVTSGMEDLYFSPTQQHSPRHNQQHYNQQHYNQQQQAPLQMSLHDNNPGVIINQTINAVPSNPAAGGPITPQYSQYQQTQPQQPHATRHPSSNSTPLRQTSSTPYPAYGSSTPPPVFASKESVTSPNSNPISATSSVTNFNLSVPLDQAPFSKSENSLVAPSFNKFGHNRSVSSTSSFFYDRSDNASMVDFNQNVIQSYLGRDAKEHLVPRIKTIDLYRQNAKKSNDPAVLFQYAQYMLQTALLLDAEPTPTPTTSSSQSSESRGTGSPIENSPRRGPVDFRSNGNPSSKKTKSSSDAVNGTASQMEIDDKRLKKALLKEAVHYLKKLSDKGYVEAQYLLGDAYSSGALDKIENREAFMLFQAAAKHGHIESAYRTSYCYEEGLGTGRDARKAVEYLKIAAAKNHPAAMYKLGVYSFYAKMGLPNNMNTKKMGIKWLTRATGVASELIAAAPYELGKLYYYGFEDIVIQDKKYALELYAQAAALGHIQSAAILGQHYEVGDVVPQDSNLSIHYYTQAALGGDPNSMLAMCAWYLVGSEPYLPKDEVEAYEWAKRAAACNLPKAQFALANFYEKGIGCFKNVNEAQTWYKKAALNGEEKSLSRITDKEVIRKIQKYVKKRPAVINEFDGTTSTAAQEKDCIIM